MVASERLASWLRGRLLMVAVGVPTLLAAIHHGFWASDVYVSESRFVVRSPDRQARGPLLGFLQGTTFGKAHDDSQTIREYILSRDALKVLVERVGLREAYADPAVDRLSRFGGIDPDVSFEALHRYWQQKVEVQADPSSSVVTLSVRAFTARDAAEANRVLLERSEELVNRLNERGRQDLIRYARLEVAQAEKAASQAGLALAGFRNAQAVVDPERQAAVQLQQIAKLQDELIATTTHLSQLVAFTPANPQVPSLQQRSRSLREEIARETAAVAGGQGSLANKSAAIQRFALDAEFANKQLASALASLEQARNEAQRQQVYLERISDASHPDAPQEPRRLRNVLATLLIGLLSWGLLAMVWTGIREHRD